MVAAPRVLKEGFMWEIPILRTGIRKREAVFVFSPYFLFRSVLFRAAFSTPTAQSIRIAGVDRKANYV
jgi:hypothetical protein